MTAIYLSRSYSYESDKSIESVADEVELLMQEYADAVGPAQVSATFQQARRELEGQIPPGAFPELVHRLAEQRLAVLSRG